MKSVNVHEAKTHFSALLAELEHGRDRIVICRNGTPIADLVPHHAAPLSMDGDPQLGPIVLNYDPAEPLTEEEWPEDAR